MKGGGERPERIPTPISASLGLPGGLGPASRESRSLPFAFISQGRGTAKAARSFPREKPRAPRTASPRSPRPRSARGTERCDK